NVIINQCRYITLTQQICSYATSLKSTGTTRDTPCSTIVTPYIMSVLAIVRLLCETMMNCEFLEKSLTMLLNLSIFVSSKGASTSSNIQNGAGFSRYSENNNAVAVRSEEHTSELQSRE